FTVSFSYFFLYNIPRHPKHNPFRAWGGQDWYKEKVRGGKNGATPAPPPPLYEGIKQRIIAGEITYEQGRAEIFEYHAQRAKQHQA
ncbi:antitoxin VbhA family protein, partial [Escherichia coli]|uniref:antitoxin VbhA family protein n=1 Tax=Escherichia coli TaxID=562 RepID=UPI001BDB99CC